MADLTPGQQDEQDLRNSGYSDEDVNQWKGQTADTLSQAGYSDQEVADHFGVKEPDVSAMKSYIHGNLKAYAQEQKAKHETIDTAVQPLKAQDWQDALAAGWGMSASGIDLDKGKSPIEIAGDASRAMQLANMGGQIAGDAPSMVVGGAIGALSVGAATMNPVAAGLGAYAGAQALPKALRQILMDHYEKGDITTSSEFMQRLKDTTMEALKGGVVGGLTGGAGMIAGRFGTPLAQLAAEGATMTTAGAAVEGRLPNANDFVNTAITMGTLHTLGVVPKLRNIFTNEGVPPEQVADAVQDNVVLKQEVFSDDPNLPKEAQSEPPETVEFPKSAVKPFGPAEGPETETTIPVPKQVPEDVLPDRPEPKGEEEESEDLKGAREKIRSRLGEQSESTEEGLSWAKFRKDYVDDLDPVKAASKAMADGKDVAADKDPYQLMQRAKNWRAQLKYTLKYGTMDFATGEKNGEGLAQVLKDVDDPAKFRDFAMAKKALESDEIGRANVAKQMRDAAEKVDLSDPEQVKKFAKTKADLESKIGKDTGIDLEAAKQVVDADESRYGEQWQRLVDLQNRMLKYSSDSGILSEQSYNNILKSRKNPIPFYRVQDDEPFIDGGKGGEGKLFQPMKGSERLILDPFQSLAYNMAAILKAAEKNRAMTAFTEQVKGSMNGDYYAEKVGSGSKTARPLSDNEFQILNDGTREVWRTTKDLSDAFKSLDYHPGLSNLLVNQFLKPAASALRKGTVLNPDFMVRHFTRGNILAAIQTKFGQIPIYDSLQAVGNMWKEDSTWQSFLKTGGASDASVELNHYLENNIWDLNKETGSTLGKTWNVVRHPIQALGMVAEIADNAPRLAEAKRSGMLDGSLADQITASSAARDITLDYMRAGAKVRAVTSIIPFLNVSIQGTDRTVRGFQDNPLKMTAKSLAAITLPSVLNWWVNKDDSRYKDAANWEKDLFWLVMGPDKWEKSSLADAETRSDDLKRRAADGSWEVNNGKVYRIPKPFELGVLMGSLPERALNALYQKDASQFKDFDSTVIHGLMPNFLPTGITPMLEQANNKSYFTGNSLVNPSAEKVLPQYQYSDYTSETAKQLGKIIGYVPGVRDIGPGGPNGAKLASPMVIDNYIRTWSGTLGNYAVGLTDKALHAAGLGDTTERPDTPLEAMPFIKAFMVRNPSAKAQPIQDFEDQVDEAMREFNSNKFTNKHELSPAVDDPSPRLTGIQKAMTNQRRLIQNVYNDPKMNGSDKQQLIENTYWQMLQEAKSGLEQIKQFREDKQKGQ